MFPVTGKYTRTGRKVSLQLPRDAPPTSSYAGLVVCVSIPGHPELGACVVISFIIYIHTSAQHSLLPVRWCEPYSILLVIVPMQLTKLLALSCCVQVGGEGTNGSVDVVTDGRNYWAMKTLHSWQVMGCS